jgi:hypothetical protein
MERESTPHFPDEGSRPMAKIGVRRAMVQGDADDDVHLPPTTPTGHRQRALDTKIFRGGAGGVRAEWHEWRKTLSGLQQTSATVPGIRWQYDE